MLMGLMLAGLFLLAWCEIEYGYFEERQSEER